MARFSVGDEESRSDGKRKNRGDGVEETHRRSSKRGNSEREDERGEELEEEEENEVHSHRGEKSDGEEEGGEQEEGGESSGFEKCKEITVRIDPDVLDCPVCYEHLHAPLFQCQRGHLVCSSCHGKLLNKCHVCSSTTGYSRCIALEKVIESIKIRCSNAKYGCKKRICYTQREAHEETCIYAPCFCPISGCTYEGSTKLLSKHILGRHGGSSRMFKYNQTFQVMFVGTEPFIILYGQDGYLFLLLNNNVAPMGNAVSIVCIRPSNLGFIFSYELTTSKSVNEGSRLFLQSSMSNVREWKGVYPMKVFLLIPPNFCSPTGKIVLDVQIQKIGSYVSN